MGDVVLDIGNPFGRTLTLGISTFEEFIRTDAAAKPGHSGGALVNAGGELAGISAAIFHPLGRLSGGGFAIPAHVALQVLGTLPRHGRVIRGWLGVEVQDLSPALAESFGLAAPRGGLVAGLLPGGPKARAGIQPGEVLLEVEGRAVEDARAALDRIAALRPGREARPALGRGGRRLSLTVRIGERAPPAGR